MKIYRKKQSGKFDSLKRDREKLLAIKRELYRIAEELEKLTENPEAVLKKLEER